MTAEQTRDALLAAVQAEVACRRRAFTMTDALSEQIGRMVPLLTGETFKFAAVLCGGCGSGKTTLVKAVQNLLCYLNVPIPDGHGKVWGLRLCDTREIAHIARTDYQAFLTLMRIPMLAVDDVGIEPLEVMEYGNVVSPIVELLTKRCDGQLFTLLTTTLTPEGIRKRYGDRIANRLNEMAVVIPFKNSSYRAARRRRQRTLVGLGPRQRRRRARVGPSLRPYGNGDEPTPQARLAEINRPVAN